VDKKFQQVTLIIASDDLGGDRYIIPPLDILCDLIADSADVDLIAFKDVKNMQLTIEDDQE
tara:strand:- start:104 stop:286 length:183 start_codon:yes stop_codon:yes gene_type:complete